MAEHNTLTGSQLHEPKGVATATSGQVYTANGSGSGVWTTPPPAAGTITQGIYNYNDLATTSTPIPLTLASTQYELTNDGAGAQTTTAYGLSGITNMWNTSTDRFDFSGLSLGDTVDIRYDIDVITTSPNTAFSLDLELGVGATPYQLNLVSEDDKKSAGTYKVTGYTSIYLGNTLTRDNPARILASADSTGVTIVVNGWYIRPLRTN